MVVCNPWDKASQQHMALRNQAASATLAVLVHQHQVALAEAVLVHQHQVALAEAGLEAHLQHQAQVLRRSQVGGPHRQ